MKKIRVGGKQIVLFDTTSGILASDNRCPHEGYPLSEGSLSEGSLSGACILTCNWHNWKFNLENGDNLYGGDRLRTYPVEVRDQQVWVDISDPPFSERYQAIVESLKEAFDDHDYDRIAREIARLIKLGADPMDVPRLAIQWSWQRMEFGWTHAYAGMADWLELYDEYQGDRERQLVCLVECVAHTAFDVLREPEYPYTGETAPFDESRLLEDIEQENEGAAIAAIRGGLADGLGFADFERALSHAALAHYNDFGHSLIYVTKARILTQRLGPEVETPLLLSLCRSILFASREDRIPEFRDYAGALESWGKGKAQSVDAVAWRNKGIRSSLQLAVEHSNLPPPELHQALLLANANNLLDFDLEHQDRHHVPVSDNVGWLDFTHGLTFAGAVRGQCGRFPELWPQGLLQMACFCGRNAAFTADGDLEALTTEHDFDNFGELLERVLDHGQQEYIISVHWLKTALVVREEMARVPAEGGRRLRAALHRFLSSRQKRRQARRTAYQSLRFVDRE